MLEVWLFGTLVGTLASTVALLLVLVALGSVTFVAVTLVPVLERTTGARGRRVGVAASLGAFAFSLLGLHVGAPGELMPTLAIAALGALAVGSTTTLAWLGGARAHRALASARDRHIRQLEGARVGETRRLASERRAFLEGDDLDQEVSEAKHAVLQLRTAVDRLAATHDSLAARAGALGDAATSEVGRDLVAARDDVDAKRELGRKLLAAAEAAAFGIACRAPVKRLLRRRPREALRHLEGSDVELDGVIAPLRAFVTDAQLAREALTALEPRDNASLRGPWTLAVRDVEALSQAYSAVVDRLEIVRVRVAALGDMDTVARAAGEVSLRARSSGLDAGDLSELVGEVTRAELAITTATPDDPRTSALADALARSAVAMDAGDGASIDDLLQAMRELA